MIRVYIAAPKQALSRARKRARLAQRLGYVVTSPWHEKIYEGQPDPSDPEIARKILDENYRALFSSDVLIALTREGVGREVYCEINYALNLRSVSAVIWSKEEGGLSLSAHDRRVTLVDNDRAAFAYLQGLYGGFV